MAYFRVIFAKYCGFALKHLVAFMHWVAMPAYAKISLQRYHHRMSITVTSPKLNSTQGAIATKSVMTNEDNGQLLFYGRVDITAAVWKDGHNECWRGVCHPSTVSARGFELLWQRLAIDKVNGERLTRAIIPWPDCGLTNTGLGLILIPIRS